MATPAIPLPASRYIQQETFLPLAHLRQLLRAAQVEWPSRNLGCAGLDAPQVLPRGRAMALQQPAAQKAKDVCVA